MGGFLCTSLVYGRRKLIGHMLLLKSVSSCSQSIMERFNHCKGDSMEKKEKGMKGKNTTSEKQGSGWTQVILCATSQDSCLIFQTWGRKHTVQRTSANPQQKKKKRGSGGCLWRCRVNNGEVMSLQHAGSQSRKRAWDTAKTSGLVFRPVARKLLPNNGDFDGQRALLQSLSAPDLASTASFTHTFFSLQTLL